MAFDAADGQVVLFGGVSGVGSEYRLLNDTWTWDGARWTQQQPSTPPAPRIGSAIDFDAAAQAVLLFGGNSFQPPNQVLADTWMWHGGAWTELS